MLAVLLGWHMLLIFAGLSFLMLTLIWHLGAMTSILLMGGTIGIGVYRYLPLTEVGGIWAMLIALVSAAAAIGLGILCLGALVGLCLELKRRSSKLYVLARLAEAAIVTSGPAWVAGWATWTIIVENGLPATAYQRATYAAIAGLSFAAFAYGRWRFLMREQGDDEKRNTSSERQMNAQ